MYTTGEEVPQDVAEFVEALNFALSDGFAKIDPVALDRSQQMVIEFIETVLKIDCFLVRDTSSGVVIPDDLKGNWK